MGRKVHPYGFRLGVTTDWRARWYAEGAEYGEQLIEDIRVRKIIRQDLGRSGVSDIEIERFPKQVSVTIHTAKPGIIIGRKGAKVNDLKRKLEALTNKKVRIEVEEINRPELVAALVAESIVQQVEKRVSHKRAMKQAVQRAMRLGARVCVSPCRAAWRGRRWLATRASRKGASRATPCAPRLTTRLTRR